MRLLATAAVFATWLAAEDPVRVEYTCTEEDIQTFGLTCSAEEPCAVFLELAAVDATAGRLFLTGNLHTAKSTLYSILLASEDAGATWKEPFARQAFSALEQIQFFGLEHGWIAGSLLQPTPKDAFLLLSTDGGKTWRRAPLFEEPRPGWISQFRFDSRTNGMLVIEAGGGRHELYESMTGGESWSVKEVSASAIRLKTERPPDASGWRLRADSRSKTYRIERSQGEKWETVASFLIHIADCK